jgi:hypothetical protein
MKRCFINFEQWEQRLFDGSAHINAFAFDKFLRFDKIIKKTINNLSSVISIRASIGIDFIKNAVKLIEFPAGISNLHLSIRE